MRNREQHRVSMSAWETEELLEIYNNMRNAPDYNSDGTVEGDRSSEELMHFSVVRDILADRLGWNQR